MNRNSRIEGIYATGDVSIDGVLLNPIRSQNIRNHSPDGFSWSYRGSGCAQFALALLLEATNRDEALEWYQDFKEDCIASLSKKDIDFSAEIVYDWLEKRRKGYGN